MAIAVDFDGPIHDYRRGWQDGSIYGDETPGAFAALRSLLAVEPVYVFTSRPVRPAAAWLAVRGFTTLADDGSHAFWNRRGVLLVTNRKLPAHAYIDDRAVPFTGDWHLTVTRVANLIPVERRGSAES